MCPPLDLGVVHSVEEGTPFHATLGAKVVAIDHTSATLSLDCPEGLRNHLGGPHAAALFGLAEASAAAVLLSLFDDLVAKGVLPVVRSAEIRYQRIAVGTVTALATFGGDERKVRDEVATTGRSSFPVDVVVTDAHGTQTTVMRAEMVLKQVG
jgi:acyl-coenzyme A thioesterase PaaI-like protein